MAKKKDQSKCIKCGFRIALAVFHLNGHEVEAEFDQEPYEADVVEPVIINREDRDCVIIDGSFDCHVCPKCGWVRDVTVQQ